MADIIITQRQKRNKVGMDRRKAAGDGVATSNITSEEMIFIYGVI